MDESPERRPPSAGPSPRGYLPRLRRAGAEEVPATEPGAGQTEKKANEGASGKKAKKSKKETSGTPKGVLLEETPAIDRVEVRQKVRIIGGSVAVVLFLIVSLVVYRVLTPGSRQVEKSDTEKFEFFDVQKIRLQNETEAGTLLERGHDASRRGNHGQAVKILTRVSGAYPETRAAEAAREALARPVQHLPMFPDSPPPPAGAAPARASGERVAGTPLAAPAPVASSPEEALAASNPAPAPRVAAGATPNGANPAVVDPPPSRTLPGGFRPRDGVGVDASGWPLEIVCSRDGAMMVLVPGGPFVMGRDGTRGSESPAHLVKVSTFYIDKHEVTNRQFDLFLKETGPRPERTQALARDGNRVSLSEDFPVVMVSAKEARLYADWAGKRLPTEAQWEKSARGTDQRLYPWGVAAPVWVKPRAALQIDPVMSFPNDLSPCGAYDLAGNAMEWTRDWYDANAYASYRGLTAEDPSGPSSRPPTVQVAVRGFSRQWNITAREGILEALRLPYLGFRCVLPVEGPDSIFHPAVGPEAAPPGTGPGGAVPKGAVPF